MIVSLILLMSSDIAFKTSGCHEAKFSADLDKTELLITRGANISPGIYEMPTRRGSFECVRYTFLLDGEGRAIDVRAEESSDSPDFNFSARQALGRYRFKLPARGRSERLMILFREIVARAPFSPEQIGPPLPEDQKIH